MENGMLEELETVMETERGRAFVWRLIKKAGVINNAMTGNSWTYFRLGMQVLGNELMRIMYTDRFLKLFRMMQDEALLAERARLNADKEKKDV